MFKMTGNKLIIHQSHLKEGIVETVFFIIFSGIVYLLLSIMLDGIDNDLLFNLLFIGSVLVYGAYSIFHTLPKYRKTTKLIIDFEKNKLTNTQDFSNPIIIDLDKIKNFAILLEKQNRKSELKFGFVTSDGDFHELMLGPNIKEKEQIITKLSNTLEISIEQLHQSTINQDTSLEVTPLRLMTLILVVLIIVSIVINGIINA